MVFAVIAACDAHVTKTINHWVSAGFRCQSIYFRSPLSDRICNNAIRTLSASVCLRVACRMRLELQPSGSGVMPGIFAVRMRHAKGTVLYVRLWVLSLNHQRKSVNACCLCLCTRKLRLGSCIRGQNDRIMLPLSFSQGNFWNYLPIFTWIY